MISDLRGLNVWDGIARTLFFSLISRSIILIEWPAVGRVDVDVDAGGLVDKMVADEVVVEDAVVEDVGVRGKRVTGAKIFRQSASSSCAFFSHKTDCSFFSARSRNASSLTPCFVDD